LVLKFKLLKSKKELDQVIDFNIDAFSDSFDFDWTVKGLQNEVKDGWELYAASIEKEIVAALLLRKDGTDLLTKNTSIKRGFQGSGYSHEIKNFFEARAKEFSLKRVVHLCQIDNFRMYSLNESHGYEKKSGRGGNKKIVEWVKSIK
jgi:hypothetical protein